MEIGRIKGATRVLGKAQGYRGLPVRDERLNCGPGMEDVAAMTTCWYPSPDEIARIAVGAPIYLRVLGHAHPPVLLEVGEVPAV